MSERTTGTVWFVLKNGVEGRGIHVYGGIVEAVQSDDRLGPIYKIGSVKGVYGSKWIFSPVFGTEGEAVRYAMDQLMDDMAIWTDNFRSLSVRLKELRTESDSAMEKK